jgi:thiamine biosynthesis protein ThiI
MTDPVLEAPELLLVRYGELALKGGNRREFERVLARNARRALEAVTPCVVERQHGRLLVRPERRLESAAERLQQVFGISSISPAWRARAEPDAIVAVARHALAEALADLPGEAPVTIRIRTNRGNKAFTLTSTELDRYVAERILGDPRLVVQLKNPQLEVGIDVREEGAWVFAARLPGPGGLPVGTQGRGMCLLSGGIDSPVAAWYVMKRGLMLDFVTFHSAPFIGESARRKVADLVRLLTRWQPRSRLFVVPFAETQLAIRDLGSQRSYRTVLYRRMMQRIATSLARREGARALVTGECLGQVASQTIENMTCIEDAAGLPVLRPLIGFDKLETIAVAERIGTFEVSRIQEPDCCTLFMPDRPVIRGELDVCRGLEADLDLAGLEARAIEATEVESFLPVGAGGDA